MSSIEIEVHLDGEVHRAEVLEIISPTSYKVRVAGSPMEGRYPIVAVVVWSNKEGRFTRPVPVTFDDDVRLVS